MRLCANEIIRRRRLSVDAGLLRNVPGPPSDPEQYNLSRKCGVLSELAPRHRRALVLNYLYGYRYDQMARMEGVSVHGIDSLLLRARRALVRALRLSRRGRGGCTRSRPPRVRRRGGRFHERGPQRLRAPPTHGFPR